MRRFPLSLGIIVAIIALVVTFQYAPSSLDSYDTPTEKEIHHETATVTRIIDGDSLEVELPGGTVTQVRLLGLDAPEFNKTKPHQCYAIESRLTLLNLLPVGSTVELVSDGVSDDTDTYGRLLRYARHKSIDVNSTMIEIGAARFLDHFPVSQADDFSTVENFAREHTLGIWHECTRT